MKNNIFTSILIITNLNFLSAQDKDFDTHYYNGTIYIQQGVFGQKYIKGGESSPLISIGRELNRYPETEELYSKYLFMRILGMGILITGPLLSSVLLENDPGSFMTVYLGSLFLGVFASVESMNKLNEAIWVYNRKSLIERVGGNASTQNSDH